jgi:hypothetical protein
MESNKEGKTDYSAWSQEKLIQRVTQLEAELKARNRRSLIPDSFNFKNRMLMDIA